MKFIYSDKISVRLDRVMSVLKDGVSLVLASLISENTEYLGKVLPFVKHLNKLGKKCDFLLQVPF